MLIRVSHLRHLSWVWNLAKIKPVSLWRLEKLRHSKTKDWRIYFHCNDWLVVPVFCSAWHLLPCRLVRSLNLARICSVKHFQMRGFSDAGFLQPGLEERQKGREREERQREQWGCRAPPTAQQPLLWKTWAPTSPPESGTLNSTVLNLLALLIDESSDILPFTLFPYSGIVCLYMEHILYGSWCVL